MMRRGWMAALAMCALISGGTLDARPVQTATPAAKTAPAVVINLNTATAADLEKLPGVGPAMAQRIVEYRQKNGDFKKIEDLMNVKGVGERSFLRLKPLITVTSRTADR